MSSGVTRGGVDPASPRTVARAARRQFEFQRLPVGVQDQVERSAPPRESPPQKARCGSRRPSPAGSGFTPCQALLRFADQLRSGSCAGVRVPRRATSRRAMSSFTKRCTSACFVKQRPVEPAGLVVLAIGVVVAALACGGLRRPSAIIGTPSDSSVDRQKVLHLAVAQRLDRRDRRVGPSTPQFQLRLSLAPSRLSSPLASLCFSL